MLRARNAFRWTVVCTIVLAAAFFGPGVYRGISDSTENTYKELKVFSDVIDMVQKNYVDEVESKKLIEDAIQGMVGSLDPHSSLLTPEAFKELQIDTPHTKPAFRQAIRSSRLTAWLPKICKTPSNACGAPKARRSALPSFAKAKPNRWKSNWFET